MQSSFGPALCSIGLFAAGRGACWGGGGLVMAVAMGRREGGGGVVVDGGGGGGSELVLNTISKFFATRDFR